MKQLINKYLAELTPLSEADLVLDNDYSQWSKEHDMKDWQNGIAILRHEFQNERCRATMLLEDVRMLDGIRDKYLSLLHEDAMPAFSAGYSVEWETDFMAQLETEYEETKVAA